MARYSDPAERQVGPRLARRPGQQQAELERFQQERLRIRKELRDVRRGLDVEIKELGTWLKILNIALVPSLLEIGAMVLCLLLSSRLLAGRAAAHTG